MQASEIDQLPFYEYEYTATLYNDMIKERKSNEDNISQNYNDKYNVKALKQNMGNIKLPSGNSIKLPN